MRNILLLAAVITVLLSSFALADTFVDTRDTKLDGGANTGVAGCNLSIINTLNVTSVTINPNAAADNCLIYNDTDSTLMAESAAPNGANVCVFTPSVRLPAGARFRVVANYTTGTANYWRDNTLPSFPFASADATCDARAYFAGAGPGGWAGGTDRIEMIDFINYTLDAAPTVYVEGNVSYPDVPLINNVTGVWQETIAFNATDNVTCEINRSDIPLFTSRRSNWTNYGSTEVTGLYGNARNFSNTTKQWLTMSYGGWNYRMKGTRTFMTWLKIDDLTPGKQYIFYKGSEWGLAVYSTGHLNVEEAGGSIKQFGVGFTTGKWYHIALTYSSGTYNLYVNGTFNETAYNVNDKVDSRPLYLSWDDGGSHFRGALDEVKIYNTTLDADHIRAETFSWGPNTTGTMDSLVFYQGFEGANYQSYVNTSLPEGNYSIEWNCTDGVNTAVSGTFWIYKDETNPVITSTWPAPNNSTTVNDTNRTPNLSAFTTDDRLYLANLTIFNSTGDVVYNNFSGDLLAKGWTRYDWNETINFSGLRPGSYLAFFESSDGHTSKKIDSFGPEFDVDKKKISYKSPKKYGEQELNIELLSSDSDLLDFWDVKTDDRHRMVYKFKAKVKEYINGSAVPEKTKYKATYRVTSDKPLIYHPDDEFNCWLNSDTIKGIWYDCNLDDVTATYEVKQNSVYSYDLDIVSQNPIMRFNSLGGANYNSENYTITVNTNVTLFLNDTLTGSLVNNFTGIAGNYSQHTNGYNVTFYVAPGDTIILNATRTGYTTTAVNYVVPFSPRNITLNATSAGAFIRFYDERTNALIVGPRVSLEILTPNSSESGNTTTGLYILSGHASGSYEIRYNAPGYDPRTWYATLNQSVVQQLSLFLLNSSYSNLVTLSLIDQDSLEANNITVWLQRYFANTNSYNTVSMSTTNFEGEVGLYVELYDVYYKMVYLDIDGNILKITDPSPFLSTSVTDTIDTGGDQFYSWASYDDVHYNLTFVNNSGTIYARLFYLDSNAIVRYACLEVQRYTTTGITDICNNCTSGPSSTLTCVIDHTVPGQYKAVGTIDTNSTSSWVITSAIWYFYTQDDINRFREPGVFLAAGLVITMGLMGIATAAGSVMLLIVGIIGVAVLGLVSGFSVGWIWYIVTVGLVIIFVVRKSEK